MPKSSRAWIRDPSRRLASTLDELAKLGRHDIDATTQPLGRKVTCTREPVGRCAADADQLGRLRNRNQQWQISERIVRAVAAMLDITQLALRVFHAIFQRCPLLVRLCAPVLTLNTTAALRC